ncbi:hypothetical protein TYRP_010365 [Tyrophagus putrescentiae]|nr:hypothetical protein TYRP_010365 [Tyrophagus putrescentiae]
MWFWRKLGQSDGEEVGDVLGVDFDLQIAGLQDFGREAVDVAVAVEQVDGFVANVPGNQIFEKEFGFILLAVGLQDDVAGRSAESAQLAKRS